jgi:MFS family permease
MLLRPARVRPVLAAAPMISYADRFGFLPVMSAAAAGLPVPAGVIGVAVTVYFLLYGLAQQVIGRLSDRYGRVLVLRTALGGRALADLAAGLAPHPAVLIGARAVAGVAMATAGLQARGVSASVAGAVMGGYGVATAAGS